jgi:signal transduction histidine kinase
VITLAICKVESKNHIQVYHSSAVSLEYVLPAMRHTTVGFNQQAAVSLSIDDRIGLEWEPVVVKIHKLLEAHGPKSLLRSEEAEKKRISQELHDGLGQILTSINLHVQQCMAYGDSVGHAELPQGIRDSLSVISDMAKQAMGEVRAICSALRPAILDDLGVIAAISWQCRQISQGCSRINVETRFEIDESMIPERHKTVLYRIVQEGLNNAVKYSQSKVVRVCVYHTGQTIELSIQDFGVGFDPSQIEADRNMGMGLTGMQERSESVGGRFKIDTAIGSGVEIRVTFPLEGVSLSG